MNVARKHKKQALKKVRWIARFHKAVRLMAGFVVARASSPGIMRRHVYGATRYPFSTRAVPVTTLETTC